MTIIKNTFHNTEYRSTLTRDEINRRIESLCSGDQYKAWARRIRKHLCGINGCTCGNEIGERG